MGLTFRKASILLLAALLMLTASPVSMAGPAVQGPDYLRPYLVRVAEPNLLVAPGPSMDDLIASARERQRGELTSIMRDLASAGLAGASTFDESEQTFRVELSETARARLGASPLVAALEPQLVAPFAAALSPEVSIQQEGSNVSSIIFIQVYTPFVWGHARIGGLSVQLTLEDGSGNVKAVPKQGTDPTSIKIDRSQLYFETVFVDPANSSTSVLIRPGDRVHVVTTGDDPATPEADPPQDKRVAVDDVQAWTSYETDVVTGITSPDSTLFVTVSSGSLSLSRYLESPGPTTYAGPLTADGAGNFSAASFRSTSDPTYKTADLKPGSTGFVRVRHPDGNEVYSLHGQSVKVLENSSRIHGYAFKLPSQPGSLEIGVTVSRPAPNVIATLKDSAGQVKDTRPLPPSFSTTPYNLDFNVDIVGGDIVEVSINQGHINRVATAPLTANVDLAANQVTGTGPAGAQLLVSAGRIDGYITSSSSFKYIENRAAVDASGQYASGQFKCGTSNYLTLRAGSFGYLGYEDPGGNFIYLAFASPTNHVMVDFPFLEGWVANGKVRPVVTVRDSEGTVKQGPVSGAPDMLYMTSQKLFINVYYNMSYYSAAPQLTQFILPRDIVTVESGGQTFAIPVDRITAYVDTDGNVVAGQAPPGATVRVVPADDRAARREVAADASGNFAAGNPFTSLNTSCVESTKNEDFAMGDAGRAYVRQSDGSEVFAAYGRSMQVNQNEDYLELYLYVLGGLDWLGTTPRRMATVTLTKPGPPPSTSTVQAQSSGASGKTVVRITDAEGQRVLIRPGDTLTATFDEGPIGLTRPVTMTMGPLALITASPDVDDDTLAGVGPRGWNGLAVSASRTVRILPTSSTAYGPLRFANSNGTTVDLVRGNTGTVWFSDLAGHRVWIAWSATDIQVKILGWLRPGDTQVCGKAAPGSTVRIHDVTNEGQDIIIGTGTADSQGSFCVTVTPLYEGQVVMAEADGTFSQPVTVRVWMVFLPYAYK